MDAFDADVLISAATPGDSLGRRVRALFLAPGDGDQRSGAGIRSLVLLPEVLTKPTRQGAAGQLVELDVLLARLDLLPLDLPTAQLAARLGATYRLKAADAVHLGTAVRAGADRFITNNQRDFPKSIVEIDVTYPLDLPDPG